MTKTITLTDIKIQYWTVNVELQNVTVSYRIVDDQSNTWETGEAVFWAAIPDPGVDMDGNPLPAPDNYYQLPAKYFSLLTDLTQDARTTLLHLIGG